MDHTNTFFEERVGGNSTNCPKIEAKIVHDNKNENISKSDVQTYTEEQNIDNDVCKEKNLLKGRRKNKDTSGVHVRRYDSNEENSIKKSISQDTEYNVRPSYKDVLLRTE